MTDDYDQAATSSLNINQENNNRQFQASGKKRPECCSTSVQLSLRLTGPENADTLRPGTGCNVS